MAGSLTDCRCGRTIAVPSLSQLRRDSGDDPYSTNAMDAIRLAYAGRALPGNACVECGLPTDDHIRCHVTCERSLRKWSLVNDTAEESLVAFLAGVILPFVHLVKLVRSGFRTRVKVEQFGRDTSIEIVFCLCGYCRASGGWLGQRRLRRLASRIPEYKRLFTEYPLAQVRITAG
jgi:hypothetical protein